MKNLILTILFAVLTLGVSAQTTLSGDYNFTGTVVHSDLGLTVGTVSGNDDIVQDSATAITVGVALVPSNVSNDSTSVKLPAATAGKIVYVINYGADVCAIFPATGDSIDAGAANAAVYIATSKDATFIGIGSDAWRKLDE